MKQISRRDFETYKRVKKFMGENELSEESLRKYINCKVHLKVTSKGMEPREYNSLSDAARDIGVSRQTLEYAHKHKKLFTRRNGGAKIFFIEWLELT